MNKKEQFFKNIGDLSKFDKIFWTDRSVLENGISRLSCISFDKPIKNPYDKNKLIYSIKACILEPKGWLCCLCDTEIEGISSVLKHILKNTSFFRNKNSFIGMDSQSTLLKLEQSLINKYYYLGINISSL